MLSNASRDSINKELKFCECGCGEQIPKYYEFYKCKIRHFKKGHAGFQKGHPFGKRFEKGTLSPDRKGKNHHNWKRGWYGHEGYIHIRIPDHPHAVNGYVLEHRIVMEKHLDRYLDPKEVVHHINENRSDNRIENLLLLADNHEHRRLHGDQEIERVSALGRNCLICNVDESIGSDGGNKWWRHPITKQEWLCRKCYYKIYHIEFTKKGKHLKDIS
jgi:hypothetical protein